MDVFYVCVKMSLKNSFLIEFHGNSNAVEMYKHSQNYRDILM